MKRRARSKARTFKPSPQYIAMLEFISNEPRLLGALYDMSLMPETVSDTEKVGTRYAMMAAVIAYRVGAYVTITETRAEAAGRKGRHV